MWLKRSWNNYVAKKACPNPMLLTPCSRQNDPKCQSVPACRSNLQAQRLRVSSEEVVFSTASFTFVKRLLHPDTRGKLQRSVLFKPRYWWRLNKHWRPVTTSSFIGMWCYSDCCARLQGKKCKLPWWNTFSSAGGRAWEELRLQVGGAGFHLSHIYGVYIWRLWYLQWQRYAVPPERHSGIVVLKFTSSSLLWGG